MSGNLGRQAGLVRCSLQCDTPFSCTVAQAAVTETQRDISNLAVGSLFSSAGPWPHGRAVLGFASRQQLEHHVEADEPVLRVVEGLRDRSEYLKAQRLPQVHSGHVGRRVPGLLGHGDPTQP